MHRTQLAMGQSCASRLELLGASHLKCKEHAAWPAIDAVLADRAVKPPTQILLVESPGGWSEWRQLLTILILHCNSHCSAPACIYFQHTGMLVLHTQLALCA